MPMAFVSGARGFLGGHIVDQLLARGWEVTAVIRPYSDAAALQAKGVHRLRWTMPPSWPW